VITSSDPSPDLLPGDPAVVDELVARLQRYAEQSGDAAQRLRGIESAHWSGLAADRFRAAISHVPEHLSQSKDAFTAAHTTLRNYATVLRETKDRAEYAAELAAAADAASATWAADGSVGPDPGADDRDRANSLLQRAREQLDTAGKTAAVRLRQAAASAPAPSSQAITGRTPALHADGATLRVATAHPLRDADRFADGAGQHTLALRYGAAHHVGFADGTNDSVTWESWIGAGEGRGTGQVGSELLAALGLGVLGVAAARRRRSRSGHTAMAAAGADPAALAASRPRSGAIGGVPARMRGPRTRGAVGWRTNLAHLPTARRAWPPATRRGSATADAPLVADAPSAIRHNGAPKS
jgi:hypothetical protein